MAALTREYCTYFDERYLDKAVALARSLQAHAGSHVLNCVTMTERARQALERMRLPNVVALPIAEIERRDAELERVKASRSLLAYYWTTTPAVMLHFLKHAGKAGITYLDADLYFFSRPEPLFEEEPAADLLIHEHRYDPALHWYRERAGRFNVGLVSASNTPRALAVLERWRRQCLAHCSTERHKGSCGDQVYLDDWPAQDARVHVLRHPGAGVAPWNILSATVDDVGGRPRLNGVPLVFYHFHALLRRGRGQWTLAWRYHVPEHVRQIIYAPYLRELERASEDLRRTVPGYADAVAPMRLIDRFWGVVFSQRATARIAWRFGRMTKR